MSKKKIVLFSPKPTENQYYKYAPLSLLAISSLLCEEYKIKIIVARPGIDYIAQLIEEAKDSLVVGITVLTGYPVKEALDVSRKIKMIRSDIPIIWGGRHPTIEPRQTISDESIDFVIVGQGERAFSELVRQIETKNEFDKILGLVWKKDGDIVFNDERGFENVNNFLPLKYDLLENVDNYIQTSELGKRTINYISSTGCPYKCKFCSEPKTCFCRWSGLTAERVVSEITQLVKDYGIDGVIFNDSNFFVDKNRVKKIAEGFINNNLNIHWGDANGRVDTLLNLDDELWQLIARSGCHRLLIGAESGWQNALDLIDKRITPQQIMKITEICNHNDICLTFSLMIGLPFSDLKDMTKNTFIEMEFIQTCKLIDNVLKISSIKHHFLLFIYTPYPGSVFYEDSIKLGFKPPTNLEEWERFELNKLYIPWVPKKYNLISGQLTEYIFPLLSQIYKSRLNSLKHFKYTAVIAYVFFQNLAVLRWKMKFFHLPIDYFLFKKLIFMRNK